MNCKLTTQEMTTHNGYQWKIGKKEVITTKGGELCSSDFYHYYSDPLLAVFLNPIHSNIPNPKIFKVIPGGETLSDFGLKFGSKELTLIEEIEYFLPKVTNIQRIAFGILCALKVYNNPKFVLWANNWLDGTDRGSEMYASDSASAHAAVIAARYVDAVYAASASAAWAAVYAASVEPNFNPLSVDIDLISIANKAMTYKD